MSNKEHGSKAVIIYLSLLLVMVIINMINETDILNIVYFIALVGCSFKYLTISKE